MNNLHIPTPYLIATAQRKEFEKIFKRLSPQQSKMLNSLNQSISPAQLAVTNARLENETIKLLKAFEQGVDRLFADNKAIKKALEKSSSIPPSLSSGLVNSFNSFSQVVRKISNKQINQKELDVYLQELNANINQVSNLVASTPTILMDKSQFYNVSTNTDASFLERLGYLSKQIKGITMLEHEGLEFFRELPIPDDYIVVNTGQIKINVGTSLPVQASQDGLIIDKNLKIKLTNGKEMYLRDLLNSTSSLQKTIVIDEAEWNRAVSQSLGIQSKYNRAGYIQMGKVSLENIINLNMKQAQALRNLYILHQGQEGYRGINVTHKFNVKKQHDDYKALFSYCLSRFMNRLIHQNYYMITAQGIQDSYSYYMNLFRNSHYFAPIGQVSIYPIEKEYRVAINENL